MINGKAMTLYVMSRWRELARAALNKALGLMITVLRRLGFLRRREGGDDTQRGILG